MPQIGMYDVPPLILKHLISSVARLAQLVSPSVELPADLVMPFSQELYNEEIGLLLRYSNLVIMNNKGKITHPEVSASIKYSENNHRFILSGWINAVSRATIGLGLGFMLSVFQHLMVLKLSDVYQPLTLFYSPYSSIKNSCRMKCNFQQNFVVPMILLYLKILNF